MILQSIDVGRLPFWTGLERQNLRLLVGCETFFADLRTFSGFYRFCGY
jgi:hypothetical protein